MAERMSLLLCRSSWGLGVKRALACETPPVHPGRPRPLSLGEAGIHDHNTIVRAWTHGPGSRGPCLTRDRSAGLLLGIVRYPASSRRTAAMTQINPHRRPHCSSFTASVTYPPSRSRATARPMTSSSPRSRSSCRPENALKAAKAAEARLRRANRRAWGRARRDLETCLEKGPPARQGS